MKFKFLLYLLLLFFISVDSQAQGYTVIEGDIKLPSSEEVTVTIISNQIIGEKIIYSTPVTIDDQLNGHFLLAFQPEKPMLVRFEHAFENLLVYVVPGERFKITFEAEKMLQTIKFTGAGADNNTYMAAYYNKFGKEVDQIYINMEAGHMMTHEFEQYINNRRLEKMEFYKKYKENHKFTNEFDEYAIGDIVYNWAFDRLRYAELKKWELTNVYFNFLKEVRVENGALVNSQAYSNFLRFYIEYLYYEQAKQGATMVPYVSQYEIAKNLLQNKEIKELTLAKLIIEGCMKGDIKSLEDIYSDFDLSNDNVAYFMTVNKTFSNAKKFAAGSPAPDFMLKTIDGEIVSLADFRGKVIHISFWASWCNPCLQQVKYIKEIYKELDPEEMVFLYISIDEKEDAWRNMVAKKELVGVQVLSQGLKSFTAQEYNVAGVPLYFFIDKNGNFAAKPPRPSEKERFIETARALMAQPYGADNPNGN
ncbi:MAG: TlpA disulfide reductase family protein [Chitinophagales bacterium]